MNIDQPIFEKQIRFFKLNLTKKSQDLTQLKNKQANYMERKLHQVIRQVLKDYQYFSGYRKQQLNLSEGDRVLRMNGIKIIRQNDTFFIEKYFTKQQNILKKPTKFSIPGTQRTQVIKIQYCRNETLTDPKYFLSLLGYVTKQIQYFQYLELQCYKCPAYGLQIVIYQKWDKVQYMMIESVNNYQGKNPVLNLLTSKLGDLIIEQNYNEIDPYTLRPKGLKHGIRPDD